MHIKSFPGVALAAFLVLAAGTIGPKAARAQTTPAQEDPTPEAGRALSEKLCKSCHLIGGDTQSAAPVGPPSFARIAVIPSLTAEYIRNVLIKPHAPMPDMQLTNMEMLNIISYLQTLRKDKGLPPLLPPSEPGKMKFPAPT